MSLHPARPPFHVSEDGTTVRFLVGTKLSDAHIEEVGRRFATLGDASLALDLSDVTSLSSAALGKLLALHRTVRAGGGHLTLTHLTPAVRRVFRVTRMDTLFDIREDAEAVAH